MRIQKEALEGLALQAINKGKALADRKIGKGCFLTNGSASGGF